MTKGIYLALSGAVVKHRQMEVITQNLANADTAGYKQDSLTFKDYLMRQDAADMDPEHRYMSGQGPLKTSYTQGRLVQTTTPLDLALDGDGFFSLEGNRYTRRGDFKTDKDGYLTTSDGVKVLGQKGPVKLPKGTVTVSQNGEISVDGQSVDTLRIRDMSKANLQKIGGSVFTSEQKGATAKTAVRQGVLEMSNVDALVEMVHMIETLREYEAYQKAIQTFDDAIGKVHSDMGRL